MVVPEERTSVHWLIKD